MSINDKMEKFKNNGEKIINGFVYTIVTSINVIGNLTSPFYNGGIERKFNLDINITDTGLTMDDFDSAYSSIIQELSDIKYKLIGESGNDIISNCGGFTVDISNSTLFITAFFTIGLYIPLPNLSKIYPASKSYPPG